MQWGASHLGSMPDSWSPMVPTLQPCNRPHAGNVKGQLTDAVVKKELARERELDDRAIILGPVVNRVELLRGNDTRRDQSIGWRFVRNRKVKEAIVDQRCLARLHRKNDPLASNTGRLMASMITHVHGPNKVNSMVRTSEYTEGPTFGTG